MIEKQFKVKIEEKMEAVVIKVWLAHISLYVDFKTKSKIFF